MANGTDTEKFVVLSKIRTGLKREFKFAFKAQSEICGSLGRTRARSTSNTASSCVVRGARGRKKQWNKRLKSSGSQKKEKEDIEKVHKVRNRDDSIKADQMDAMSEDEAKSDAIGLEGADGDLVESVSVRDCNDEAVLATANHRSPLVELGKPFREEAHMKKERVEDDECEKGEENDKEKVNVEKNTVELEKMENESMKTLAKVKEDIEDGDKNMVENNSKNDLTMEDTSLMCEEDSSLSSEPFPDSGQGDGKVECVIRNKPLRRFTRSLLKPKTETVKITAAMNDEEESTVNEADMNNDGVEAIAASDSWFTTPTKLEMISKKKATRIFPTKLKDLLDSGILDGLNVNYVRGLKVREVGASGLRGVIKDSGVLCFCSACEGTKVVTPATYEMHSGSTNKRPPEYIFLENGNTLREVMNVCKNSPLASLEENVQTVIGSLQNSTFCLNCRGSISEAGTEKPVILCNSCMQLKESKLNPKPRPTKTPVPVDRSLKSNGQSSYSAPKSSSSRTNSQGKITRKDLRMHKLVFEENVLPDGTEVGYFVRGENLLVGLKQGIGILCSCCQTVVSPSQFEAHAGHASRRKPFQHIYMSNGVSLHELSVALSKGSKFSIKDNDDLCSICADGGDLLCCDTCPRAYHADCLALPTIPRGKWSCKFCENVFLKERFVQHNANAKAAGRVEGIDAIEQITKRCIRIANSLSSVASTVCVLCSSTDFTPSGFDSRSVIICDQCEKEYHVSCLKDHNIDDLKELPKGHWFCCADCNKIHTAITSVIIRGEENVPMYFMNVVRMKQGDDDNWNMRNVDVRWRILNPKMLSSDETGALLSNVVSIFHQQFDPIIETAYRKDLIEEMVYGTNRVGQDFRGMHSAILTENDVIVSVAIFRVLGAEFAEIPLVATREHFQGKGYFQCLFACMETFLGYLKVTYLVLPAAEEAKSIWTQKFGFETLTGDEVSEYRKKSPLMFFEGTSMLRKRVPECLMAMKQENR